VAWNCLQRTTPEPPALGPGFVAAAPPALVCRVYRSPAGQWYRGNRIADDATEAILAALDRAFRKRTIIKRSDADK